MIGFYYTVFCLLYMFRTNLVVHHQELGIIYCITQYNRYNRAYSTIVPIVPILLCNTVYYTVLLMMNYQIRSKHVDQIKNCGIKIDYKNCAFRWPLTHCNMMHGTHNAKLSRNSLTACGLQTLKMSYFFFTYLHNHCCGYIKAGGCCGNAQAVNVFR